MARSKKQTDLAGEELDLLRDNIQAIAKRLERIDKWTELVGWPALLRDRKAAHEFECLEILFRNSSGLLDRYRHDLADGELAKFLNFSGSSTCAAVMIAAECKLRAFRDLIAIDRQGKTP